MNDVEVSVKLVHVPLLNLYPVTSMSLQGNLKVTKKRD